MTEHSHPNAALSFGGVADAYERGRPGYPRETVQWLVGRDAAVVLELGAGTGKLTRTLVSLGHDVYATDPDEAMLKVLRDQLPVVRTSQALAERLPAADQSVDVVIAAQSFHWFNPDEALPEIARVLRPGGRIALVWNERDETIPWVRRLGRLLEGGPPVAEAVDGLISSGLFGWVEEKSFGHWQWINRSSIMDLAASRAAIATLSAKQRQAKLAEILAFYDDYGRGMDGMQLPYRARCFRAQAVPGALGIRRGRRSKNAEKDDQAAKPARAEGADEAGSSRYVGEDTQPLRYAWEQAEAERRAEKPPAEQASAQEPEQTAADASAPGEVREDGDGVLLINLR